MKILAFDTTISSCTIALIDGNNLVTSSAESERARQVERLFPMIAECLAKANWRYQDLDALAVTTGPGSFTGVRIGIAAAKGLRLVTKLPVIAVSNLELIAWYCHQTQSGNTHNILVVLDAKREQVFVQLFSGNAAPLAEPIMLYYKEVAAYAGEAPLLLAGDGKQLVADYLPNGVMIDDGEDRVNATMLAAAAAKFYAKRGDADSQLAPLYIRPPDAKLKQIGVINTGC